jgi:hypothetical protein
LPEFAEPAELPTPTEPPEPPTISPGLLTLGEEILLILLPRYLEHPLGNSKHKKTAHKSSPDGLCHSFKFPICLRIYPPMADRISAVKIKLFFTSCFIIARSEKTLNISSVIIALQYYR